jgi:hypothetical protein
VYLYGIKIQIKTKKNSVTKYAGKSQIFLKIFLNIFLLGRANSFWVEPDPAQKIFRPISYMAGLSPAAWAGLMFQYERIKGWLLVTMLSIVTSEL